MKPTYYDLLKDPRWQKKRLEVMEQHNFKCEVCKNGDDTLYVHHGFYMKDCMPWDYPDNSLHCLCETCHASRHDLEHDIKSRLATWPYAELVKLLFSISKVKS